MKVPFTPKEYSRLLELVYYGLHVVTAYQGPDTSSAKRYRDIEQKVLALAESAGCRDLVEAMPNGYLAISPQLAKQEAVEQILSEHTNDAFWHELVTRLSDRDYAADQAKRHLTALTPGLEPPPSLEQQLKKIEETYWKEFEKHDLNRVVVLKGGQG